MGLGRAPTLQFMSGTTSVVTLSFSNHQGAIYLINSGDNPVWITLDGTNPAASDANGRIQIPADAAINLDDIDYVTVKAISTGAFALQVVATERPGTAGMGF